MATAIKKDPPIEFLLVVDPMFFAGVAREAEEPIALSEHDEGDGAEAQNFAKYMIGIGRCKALTEKEYELARKKFAASKAQAAAAAPAAPAA